MRTFPGGAEERPSASTRPTGDSSCPDLSIVDTDVVNGYLYEYLCARIDGQHWRDLTRDSRVEPHFA